jgi:energy-coupling factor transport system permease protein
MTSAIPSRSAGGWRLVDIVVTAVVAVAFGVVFVAWNALWSATSALFVALPPAQAILYGVWLLPGVLAGLIVRRPGAAFFAGFLAASVSALIGSQWGGDALLSGALQGGGAELGFALGAYRRWTLPWAVLAAILAGLGAAVHDAFIWYPTMGVGFWAIYGVATMLSGALVAGLGAWLLLRMLAERGVLSPFAAGREQRAV